MSGAVFADAGSLFGAGASAKRLNAQCTYVGGAPTTPKAPDGSPAGVCLTGDDASIRASVGASLLWNSPLGPLRLDLAQALKKATGDTTQVCRFGASTKF